MSVIMPSDPISRVLSRDDYLSRTDVAIRLKHATRMHERACRIAFLFALAPNGVYQAILLPKYWCALTTPFQLFPDLARSFLFCGTFRLVTQPSR